jgi:hypothetical protein
MTTERATTATEDLQAEIEHRLADLQQLRDRIRLKIHLAAMDARDAWARLEPQLDELESRAEKATGNAAHRLHQDVDRLRRSFTELLERL